jgi:hypothetical protein
MAEGETAPGDGEEGIGSVLPDLMVEAFTSPRNSS